MLLHIRTTWNKYLNAYFRALGSEMLTRSIGVETYTAVFIKHCSVFDAYHLWDTFGNATQGNRCVCIYMYGLLWWLSGKETTCQCRRHRFDPWVGRIPWRKEWQPTPVFLPGKSLGQRSLAGYSPRGRKESDTTERLSTHTHTRFISQGQARSPAETCGKSFSQRIQV